MIAVKSYSYNPLTTRAFFIPGTRKDYVNSQFCNVSVRLQFENLKCKQSNGVCYFVTFTYNDNSVVKINGFNFANNYDVRFLCNKSIFPTRLKEHGYTFKFAFFGEAGDGKGSRGRDNNPHYHALFFLYPDDVCDYHFHDSSNFLKLCHNAWNQDSNSQSKRYRALTRGNVSYSEKGALVTDDKVFSYCSMYCVKELDDNTYNNRVKDIFSKVAFFTLFNLCYEIPLNSDYLKYVYPYTHIQSIFKSFCLTYGNDLHLLRPYDKHSDYITCLKNAIQYLFNSAFGVKDFNLFPLWILDDPELTLSSLYRTISETPLFSKFRDFLVNRHSLRYRLSPHLGINGIDFIDKNFYLDVSNFKNFGAPRINLPSYYYRKYLFDMVKFEGHYLYVRNSRFKDYFMKHYTIKKYYNTLKSYLTNKPSFLKSLTIEQQTALSAIPDDIFVSYKPFRGLSFDSSDMPSIDRMFPWRYFKYLEFDQHKFYSIPYSQQHFFNKYGYVDFSLHPFFKYDKIHELSLAYDKFLHKDISQLRISEIKDYHKLKPVKQYEIYQPT